MAPKQITVYFGSVSKNWKIFKDWLFYRYLEIENYHKKIEVVQTDVNIEQAITQKQVI